MERDLRSSIHEITNQKIMVDKNRQEKTREIWIKNKIGTVTLQKEMLR